jgi:hypothetical protein
LDEIRYTTAQRRAEAYAEDFDLRHIPLFLGKHPQSQNNYRNTGRRHNRPPSASPRHARLQLCHVLDAIQGTVSDATQDTVLDETRRTTA